MRTIFSICVLFLIGCASVGKRIDRAGAESVKIGDTRERVTAAIGKPDSISRDTASQQEIWVYIHSDATAKPETFIPIVGAFAGGSNVTTDIVQVFFGSDGKVSNVSLSFGSTEASAGNTGGNRKPELKTTKPAKPIK